MEFKKEHKGIPEAVKEQRVDGSYCINSTQRLQSNLVAMQLRCTLTGFERNYQFKILSNQLNKALFSTSIQDLKLNPWFVTGLTYAEGCFTITISPSTKMKTKWRVSPSFSMNLHIKDMTMLKKLQYTLGVGTIRISKTGMAMFSVTSVKGLQVIVDHFDKYPLISAKSTREASQAELLVGSGSSMPGGSSLNWGLSDSLKEAFPNIISVNPPKLG